MSYRSTNPVSPARTFRPRWGEIYAAIVVCALVFGFVILFLHLATDTAPAPVSSVTTPRCTDAIADAGGICQGEPLPPCPTEDSDDCYWDAATMGNGTGMSFINEDGVTTYTGEVSR